MRKLDIILSVILLILYTLIVFTIIYFLSTYRIKNSLNKIDNLIGAKRFMSIDEIDKYLKFLMYKPVLVKEGEI